MKAPQITASTETEILDKAPPPLERYKVHKWFSEKSTVQYLEREPNWFELYISKVAEEKIRNHSVHHINGRKEVLGLMVGDVCKHDEGEFTLVRDVVTTDLEASAVRVRFHKASFKNLFESLDRTGFNYIIVGWYHSHPGYGCSCPPPTSIHRRRCSTKNSTAQL